MLTMLTRTVATKLKARRMGDENGQGTTEYAILVGVLVVIAILAIGLFRGNLEDLWGAISEGINGLTVPQ
ncbi:MAG TPA: class III signal peptide-containing protein [Candidatus Aphodovivens avicola]|nr:class III signal peptide-containing protein [Candidatus Aphodovivens avicola]